MRVSPARLCDTAFALWFCRLPKAAGEARPTARAATIGVFRSATRHRVPRTRVPRTRDVAFAAAAGRITWLDAVYLGE